MLRVTARLVLREFRHHDYADVREYESRVDTHRYDAVIPGEEDTKAFLVASVAWSQQDNRTHYRLALTIRPDDTVRGRISLKLNFPDIREWEIGWTVHPDYWGKGYTTEATKEMLAFAFGELHAHRVVAFCNVLNAASARVMEKAGMKQEGRLRETLWWNNSWVDEYVYAILDRDWMNKD